MNLTKLCPDCDLAMVIVDKTDHGYHQCRNCGTKGGDVLGAELDRLRKCQQCRYRNTRKLEGNKVVGLAPDGLCIECAKFYDLMRRDMDLSLPMGSRLGMADRFRAIVAAMLPATEEIAELVGAQVGGVNHELEQAARHLLNAAAIVCTDPESFPETEPRAKAWR